MRSTVRLALLVIATVPLAGCVRLKRDAETGGVTLAAYPPASTEDVDLVATRLTDEISEVRKEAAEIARLLRDDMVAGDAAVRAEGAAADAALRSEAAAADAALRTNLLATIEAGSAAFREALAKGLDAAGAEAARLAATQTKIETDATAAAKVAADAKVAAANAATDAKTAADSAAADRVAFQKELTDRFASLGKERAEELARILAANREGRFGLEEILLMLGLAGGTTGIGAVAVNKSRNKTRAKDLALTKAGVPVVPPGTPAVAAG